MTMCGRFTLASSTEAVRDQFPGLQVPEPLDPRYNIAPSQPIPTVLNQDLRQLSWPRWGLIPHWAKDPAIGHKLINARAETLTQKPSFRDPLRRQRCLVLADGFYEWRSVGRRKIPLYIHLRSQQPFAFAGLWDRWRNPQGEWITSVTVVTTEPNDLIQRIHTRMPVILAPAAYDLWLSPQERSPQDLEDLTALLRPYPAEAMQAYPVSTQVNDPQHDQPDCIQSVEQLNIFNSLG